MATLEQMMASSKYADTIAKPFEDAAKEAQRQREARRDALITMAANRMLPKGQTFEAMGMQIGNKPDPYAEIDMQTKLANLAQTQKQTELLGVKKPEVFDISKYPGFREVPLQDIEKYNAGNRADIVKVPDPNDSAKVRYITSLPITKEKKEKFDYQKQQDDIDNKYKAETLNLNKEKFKAATTAEDKEITNITKILVKTSKEIDSNPVFKSMAQKAIDISTAEAELKVNLGSARGFIIRALAKSSGEQRITEEDAKAFSGNPALAKKIAQNWESIKTGKFTDFNQQEALEMIAIAKGVASKMAHSVVDSTYDNYDLGYAVKVPSDDYRRNKHKYVDDIMGMKSQPTAPSGGRPIGVTVKKKDKSTWIKIKEGDDNDASNWRKQ